VLTDTQTGNSSKNTLLDHYTMAAPLTNIISQQLLY